MTIINEDLRNMRISIIFAFALILFVLACLIAPSKAFPASFGQSHEVHWWDDRGPKFWTTFPAPPMGCTNCHYDDTPHHGNPYQFADMQDLANTTVCDDCHSKNGAYDGVAMAKANWDTGVYTGDNLEDLQSGKEQWCVTCHDDAAPTINGITAKNVAGDNTVYGYFISGHGKYSVSCTVCHEPQRIHLDSYDRTYDATMPEDGPRGYTQGYRLKEIGGQPPLDIPRTVNYDASQFALCYACHDESQVLVSNFNNFVDLTGPTNYHAEGGIGAHMYWNSSFWDSDRINGSDSRFSCPTCHNPHGISYQGRATFSMTREDMGIVHKREVLRVSGYMNSGEWENAGGDLTCFGCHTYGPTQEYYYQLGTPPPEDPAFWTKLDSGSDVTIPTYGTGGAQLNGGFATYTLFGDTETGFLSDALDEACEFPTSNLRKDQDTIEFWYVPNFDFSTRTSTDQEYLFHSYYDATNWIKIQVQNKQIRFHLRNGGSLMSLNTTNLNWHQDEPHHIVCTYGPAQGMHIYLDKEEASYSTSSGLTHLGGMNQLPPNFYIGNSYDGLYPALGIIDDFKIYGYQYQRFESDPFLFSKMGSALEVQSPVSGNGGIVTGNVNFLSTAQHLNSALFDISRNGVVQFPTTNLNPTEDTIDFWYLPRFDPAGNADTTKHLFYCSKDATNFALIKFQNNKLRFRIQENGINHTLNTPLEDGIVWYHIVCTYGPDGMHIYINDKEANYSGNDGLSYTGGLWDGVLPTYFQVGNRSAGTARYCDGYIDELRVYGYQGSPQYLEFLTDCPVDIQVIDPLGRIVDKFQNEIRGAQYLEQDFNSDGSLDDKIIVPKQHGNYTVSVFPEPGADPGDTYTLRVIDGDDTFVLAQDVPVSTISDEKAYDITATSEGMELIKLLGPEDMASLTEPVPFKWESVGFNEFSIQFSADKQFKRFRKAFPRSRRNWLHEKQYIPTSREWLRLKIISRKNGLYWRVLGIDSNGNVASSEIRILFLPKDRRGR